MKHGGWSANKRSLEKAAFAEHGSDPLDFEQEEKDKKKKTADDKADFEITAAAVRSSKKFELAVQPADLNWGEKSKPEMVLIATYHPTSGKLQVHEFADSTEAVNAAIRACKDKVKLVVPAVKVKAGSSVSETGL